MKIGIFGDSFADEHLKPSKSWIECLRDNYEYNEVTSFGYGGTSLEWSYNNFLEHYHKYDRIIFIMTDHRRQHFFDKKSGKELLFHLTKNQSIKEIKQKLEEDNLKIGLWNKVKWKFSLSKIDKELLVSIEKLTLLYFDSLQWKSSAIYDSILQRAPNSVIIDYDSMLRLQKIDYDYMGLKLHSTKGEGKNRPCHMSLRQNEEFAEYINDNIKNGISILETLKEPEKHYTISKTNKESDILY